MRLIFVRHADSIHAADGILRAKTGCPGLTPLGFRQAKQLAERLRRSGEAAGCVCLMSSPLLRARQTAEVLHESLPRAEFRIADDLCELLPGEAEGLTRAEYRTRYGAFEVSEFPDRPIAPGGESFNGFLARVNGFHQRCAAEFPNGCVVAVAHAGVIVASFLSLFEIPRKRVPGWIDPVHTALTEWEYAGGKWILHRYNDSSHLIAGVKEGS